MMLHFRAWIAAALVLVSGVSLVGAQSAESDGGAADREARRLFLEGTDFFERGMFADARERFEDAYELSGRPELLYNVASCHDRLDERPEAIGFYERFVAALPNSPRAPGVRSRLEVLRRDVAVVDEGPVNHGAAHVSGEPAAEEPESSQGTGRDLRGPIAAFAVAGVGLVTFGTSGLVALSRHRNAEAECRNSGCREASLSRVHRASAVADVGLGVAVTGAIVGAVWLLLGGENDDADGSASVAVALGSSVVGLNVAGEF